MIITGILNKITWRLLYSDSYGHLSMVEKRKIFDDSQNYTSRCDGYTYMYEYNISTKNVRI